MAKEELNIRQALVTGLVSAAVTGIGFYILYRYYYEQYRPTIEAVTNPLAALMPPTEQKGLEQ